MATAPDDDTLTLAVSPAVSVKVAGPVLPVVASWAVKVLDPAVVVVPEVGATWVMVPGVGDERRTPPCPPPAR